MIDALQKRYDLRRRASRDPSAGSGEHDGSAAMEQGSFEWGG
jgi:hypothetical protein